MEEKLELKFAQIDKSGAINFTDKWILSEYNNGAFFLTKDNKSLVGRRIIMINDNEEEIYSENVPEKRHKKIFTQDDGEYVDFEEIK